MKKRKKKLNRKKHFHKRHARSPALLHVEANIKRLEKEKSAEANKISELEAAIARGCKYQINGLYVTEFWVSTPAARKRRGFPEKVN